MDTNIETLTVVTDTFPAHARHMDDDTECSSPEACGRNVYWRGGRPNFGQPTD